MNTYHILLPVLSRSPSLSPSNVHQPPVLILLDQHAPVPGREAETLVVLARIVGHGHVGLG